jgi:hypothetical protein
MDIGNNNAFKNLQRKYKKISQIYNDLDFLLLSIEPCNKKAYIKSPPGFSHEDLYPNDKSGDNFNYQLYLRPQLLLYLQIIIVAGASLSIFISGLLKSYHFTGIFIALFFLIFINVFFYYILLIKYLNTPLLYNCWGVESNKHLKYWFRQIPQQIKLKKKSDALWFKGLELKQKTSMYSGSYNKLWSPQKQMYYIALSDLLLNSKKNTPYIDVVLYIFPVFPTIVFLFLTVIFDSFFVESCDYSVFSIVLIPVIFFIYLFSLLMMLVYNNKIKITMEYIINRTKTNRNIPSYLYFILNKKNNHNEINEENKDDDIKDDIKYKSSSSTIHTVLFTILFVVIVGLSNVKSMLNSKECPPSSAVKKMIQLNITL